MPSAGQPHVRRVQTDSHHQYEFQLFMRCFLLDFMLMSAEGDEGTALLRKQNEEGFCREVRKDWEVPWKFLNFKKLRFKKNIEFKLITIKSLPTTFPKGHRIDSAYLKRHTFLIILLHDVRHFQEGIMCRREDFDVSNIWTLALKKKTNKPQPNMTAVMICNCSF